MYEALKIKLQELKDKHERLRELLVPDTPFVSVADYSDSRSKEIAAEINLYVTAEQFLRVAMVNTEFVFPGKDKMTSTRPCTPASLQGDAEEEPSPFWTTDQTTGEEIDPDETYFEEGEQPKIDPDETYFEEGEKPKFDPDETYFEPAERLKLQKANPANLLCEPEHANAMSKGCSLKVCECKGTVRGKKRKLLEGHVTGDFLKFCQMAEIPLDEAKKISRQRHNHPRPKSPVDYWNVHLPSTQVMLERQLAPVDD